MQPDLVPGTVKEGWAPSVRNGILKMGPVRAALQALFLGVGDASGFLSPVQYLPAGNFPALTGDVTTTQGSLSATLVAVIAAAGPVGNSNTVPVITYDAKGRLTAVTTATVTPASIGAQPLDAELANIAALSNVAGVLTNDGSGNMSWGKSPLMARQYAWSVAS